MHSAYELANELAKIFSSLQQSVIGLDESSLSVLFANPAAKSVLGFDPTGGSAEEIVSRDILTQKSQNYVCGAAIMGHKASISVVKEKSITLLFIDFINYDKSSLCITRSMISNLRNNAMGIKMSADRCFSMVGEEYPPNEKYVSVLYHYYYSLLRTITQIDSADLLERGEMVFSPVPTQLVKLCSDLTQTVSLLCSKIGVNISFSTDEKEIIAVVDPAKIEQLLLNLFANSLQHTTAGNNITLSLSRSGNKLIISLDDDGEGIPKENLSSIFNIPDSSFGSVIEQSGNSFGLYISFGIAQLHNGVLLVESQESGGTRIRVMLPTDEDPAPKFNCPETAYRINGISSALTELSDVLPSSCFGLKYED